MINELIAKIERQEEEIVKLKSERLIVDKRIHNQRKRLKEMETHNWGNNHLKTIKDYCSLLKRYQKIKTKLKELGIDHV